jgi:hypothetical protein
MGYTDIPYPQLVSSPAIVPEFEAHFTDTTAITGVNSQANTSSGIFDGGLNCINSTGVSTPLSVAYDNVSGIDAFGQAVLQGSAAMSFLRPRYDFSSSLNIPRVLALSNAHTSTYQDLVFNKYIHYMPNPKGGTGRLDITIFAVETDVTYSRIMNITTYSPYSK